MEQGKEFDLRKEKWRSQNIQESKLQAKLAYPVPSLYLLIFLPQRTLKYADVEYVNYVCSKEAQ